MGDRSFTPELVRLFLAGESTADLALAFGISKGAVETRLKRLGHRISQRKRRPRTEISWDLYARRVVMPHGPADCWMWTGSHDRAGYSLHHFCRAGVSPLVHRQIYTLLVGPISNGLVLDHQCRETGCVNPYHCEQTTIGENAIRGTSMTRNKAKWKVATHCRSGRHELTEATLFVKPSGRWRCRACSAEGQVRRAATSAISSPSVQPQQDRGEGPVALPDVPVVGMALGQVHQPSPSQP